MGIMEQRVLYPGYLLFSSKVKTTSLAGGLLTPYKGLLLAKPKGLLKIML